VVCQPRGEAAVEGEHAVHLVRRQVQERPGGRQCGVADDQPDLETVGVVGDLGRSVRTCRVQGDGTHHHAVRVAQPSRPVGQDVLAARHEYQVEAAAGQPVRERGTQPVRAADHQGPAAVPVAERGHGRLR